MKPLCFVLMPFGNKPGGDGRTVDFDSIYESLIKPAVQNAGLEPLRADEEQVGGIIHKAMFERLVLCEYAVADLTTANANVFYELGVRHAVRPWATQLLFAEGWGQLPFDVTMLRALPYQLGANGVPSNSDEDGATLTEKLQAARTATSDSPVFQLLEGFPDIKRLKTDVFRDRVAYASDIKVKLAKARLIGSSAVEEVEAELGDVSQSDAGVVIDLFLSYRAVKAWQSMIELVGVMAPPLVATVMVQEQLALSLNRAGLGKEAEDVIRALILKRGGSSESYGILGRIYKDRWKLADEEGNQALSIGYLDKAIDTYLKGFETDWRDAYPGVNATTLMEMKSPTDPRQQQLLPVVTYAVNRRIESGQPDYWDYATLLELAVLARDVDSATSALSKSLANVREAWEIESTVNNLKLILELRKDQGEDIDWIEVIVKTMSEST